MRRGMRLVLGALQVCFNPTVVLGQVTFVPNDLNPGDTYHVAIDGVDVSEFLLGKSKKSGRDGFVVYMGNDIFGVKWRDWKVHFKEQSGWNGVLREYTMPRVYNLINDPYERDNVLFPNTWVLRAGGAQLQEHVESLKEHPPIPSGAADPYVPPE